MARKEVFNIDRVSSRNKPEEIFAGILPKLKNGRSGFSAVRRELGNGMDPFEQMPGMLGYTFRELTAAINRIESVPLLLEAILGEKWAATTNRMVSVEEQYDVITPAASIPLNANPPVDDRPERDLFPFEIPRFAVQKDVNPEDVENIRAFATLGDQQSVEEKMVEVLGRMLNRIKIAEELMRRGSIDGVMRTVDVNGVVRDTNNFYELRSRTGRASAPLSFQLDLGPNADVANQLLKIKRKAEMKVIGQGVSEWPVLASSDMYDAIATHPSVKAAYQNWSAATMLLEDNRDAGFRFNGNMPLFDVGQQALPNVKGGQPYKWWSDNTIKVVPGGTTASRNAPALRTDAIGKPGLTAYASTELKKHSKGYEMQVESHYAAWNEQLEAITAVTLK